MSENAVPYFMLSWNLIDVVSVILMVAVLRPVEKDVNAISWQIFM